MALDGLDDAAIAAVLRDTRRIALVGASARPDRPSNRVMQVLLRQGYVVHGCPVVAALDDAGPLDMVDVFRASAEAGAVVDAAIRLGARTVWLQLGVIDAAAAGRARAAGLRVVMDRCPAIELPRLGIVPDETGRFT